MTRKEINANYLLAVIFYLLLIILAHSAYLNASIQNSNKSEETSFKNGEKVKDPVEKQKIYNQIEKDIKDLSLEECIKYIDWSPLIQSDYPDSSIYAIEIILKKWGDKAEKYLYFYNRLGNEYLMKDELVKSDEIYQSAYYIQKLINKDERKLEINRRNAELYAIGMIFRKNNINSMKYAYNKIIIFIKENPALTSEQRKEANRIIDVYKKIDSANDEIEKVKRIVQIFLDDLANYYNRKDKEGLTEFFINNMEDKERARFYALRGWEFFSVTKEIHFPVIHISKVNNQYLVVYGWDVKPKNAIEDDPDAIGNPTFTFKYVDKKLVLLF